MGAGHGLRRQRANQFARPQFMGGIAHRKIRCDRKRLDLGFVLGHCTRHGVLIERRRFLAGGDMPMQVGTHMTTGLTARGVLQVQLFETEHGDTTAGHRKSALCA